MAEFKESEHPRDKDGKFTDKGNSQGWTKEKRDRLFKALDFFSKNKHKTHNISYNIEGEIPRNPPNEIFGFKTKKQKKTKHHQRHIYELGYKSETEYINGAKEFWKNGEGKVYYGKARNTFCKYNINTGEYLVIDKDDYLLTYYPMTEKQFENYKIQERYIYVKN